MKVLLVAPPGIHSDALSEWLPSLAQGCEVIHTADPDVVIQDAAMHAAASLVLVDIDAGWSEVHTVIRTFVDAFPGAPVVALSAAEDDETINAAFDAGALGYVPTSYTRQVILGVLRIVLAGATHRPASSHRSTSAPRSKPLYEPRAADSSLQDYGLTPAEVEVLAKAATGKSNKAIARELDRAPGTVRAHMSSILRKLGAKNRGEAIVIAMRIDKVIRHEIQDAERGTLDRSLLLPHMAPQRLREGATIFRKGDPGRELFLLQRGTRAAQRDQGHAAARRAVRRDRHLLARPSPHVHRSVRHRRGGPQDDGRESQRDLLPESAVRAVHRSPGRQTPDRRRQPRGLRAAPAATSREG